MLFALVGGISPSHAAESIGQVKTAEGEVTIRRGERAHPIARGDAVNMNDVILTGAESQVGITLDDGTMLTLGEEGELVVDGFVYDPATKNNSLGFNFLAGSVSYVSRKIGQLSPENVVIDTPVASIGIRGTKFLMRLPKKHKPGSAQ